MDVAYIASIGLPVHCTAGCKVQPVEQEGNGRASVAKPALAAPSSKEDGIALNGCGQEQHSAGDQSVASKPLYMDATYVFQCRAILISSRLSEDGQALLVELSQTVFHPQGGGQPADIGRLVADGLPSLDVVFASKDKVDPRVLWHECRGDFQPWLGKKGLEVVCNVDEPRRRLHARLHSAGHLLDVAMMALGFRWKPGKGYHFPDGPYVEYLPSQDGRQLDVKDAKAKELAMQELASKMKELIDKKVATNIEFVDGVRMIAMDGVSCGCGGTHVEHTGEIGEVSIKKIQAKQGNIRVSYAVA
mmetsp:Transcript_2075/g.4759  ORF Transcript_2075/g.4759 Transcript_2075/m.4759 type:complete len:303 (+) Transcript_2075:30-938(+)|eukprot:s4300_g6.t2